MEALPIDELKKKYEDVISNFNIEYEKMKSKGMTHDQIKETDAYQNLFKEKARYRHRIHYLEHQDYHKERNKKYREEHKQEIKERRKKYYEDHQEKIKQYREKNKQHKHEYLQQYRETNKDRLKDYNKQRRSVIINCPCGSHYILPNKSKHLKSNKHHQYEYMLFI